MRVFEWPSIVSLVICVFCHSVPRIRIVGMVGTRRASSARIKLCTRKKGGGRDYPMPPGIRSDGSIFGGCSRANLGMVPKHLSFRAPHCLRLFILQLTIILELSIQDQKFNQ